MTGVVRIGTRGSPLARMQTELVCRALGEADPELAAPGALEVVVIRTTGDLVVDRPLAELGGKGLFCKELEAALLDRRIDLAVHSMKDLPTWLPAGLAIGAMLPRADPRDVLIARAGPCRIDELPQGAVVGTVSLRRRAQLLARRPDLRMTTLRGNLDTRLRKLEAGEVDATLLARAGLDRLGLEPAGGTVLEIDEMLPAVGQGAIGVECRADDPVRTLLAGHRSCADQPLRRRRTGHAGRPGRLLPHPDRRPCRARAGPHAALRAGGATGRQPETHADVQVAAAADGERLGRELGHELRARAGPGFFD